MDALDDKILTELMQNSRISLSSLAKKVRASREVVTYRIERLKKEGVILGFVTEINLSLLGFKEASLFLSVKTQGEREFKEFVRGLGFTAWSSEFSGVWNFGVGVYGKTNDEINAHFLEIYDKFKESIIDYRLTVHTRSKHFYEKYFGAKDFDERKNFPKSVFLDEKDKKILKILSVNSRIDSVALSSEIDLTAPAVSKRIRRLEKIGVIRKYSLFVNPAKLGFFQYSVFIKNNYPGKRQELLEYLENHRSVSFTIEYLGDPFLEFGLIVKNPYDLRELLQEIEGTFPDNRITETFLIQDEILSISPPRCVFD